MDASNHPPSRDPVQTVLVMSERPVFRQHLVKDLRRTGLFPVLATSQKHGQRLFDEIALDAVLIDLDDAPQWDVASATSIVTAQAAKPAATLMLSSDIQRRCGCAGQTCQGALCLDGKAPLKEIAGLIASHLRSDLGGASPCAADPQTLQVGQLRLDTGFGVNQVCHARSGAAVRLSDAEMDLLRCLMLHAGQLLSRQQLVQMTRDSSLVIGARTIDQNIKRLRSALAPLGLGEPIVTVRGAGYCLEADG